MNLTAAVAMVAIPIGLHAALLPADEGNAPKPIDLRPAEAADGDGLAPSVSLRYDVRGEMQR